MKREPRAAELRVGSSRSFAQPGRSRIAAAKWPLAFRIGVRNTIRRARSSIASVFERQPEEGRLHLRFPGKSLPASAHAHLWIIPPGSLQDFDTGNGLEPFVSFAGRCVLVRLIRIKVSRRCPALGLRESTASCVSLRIASRVAGNNPGCRHCVRFQPSAFLGVALETISASLPGDVIGWTDR